MPNGTITSTENTFGTVNGALSGTVAGTLTGSVGVPGPQGPPGPGSTWGTILGTLSAQTDLWSELGTKYLASNPAGYQTAGQVSTALAPYVTSATATASFYPLTGNPSAFLQAAALSPYLLSATAASTYYPLSNPSNFATQSFVTGQGYITSAALSPYLLSATAATSYYPLTGNPSSFLTASALTGYATESWVTSGFATTARGLPASGTVGQVLTKNSGTDYDVSFQTLIPGDRYLTSSTTSNTIGNGAKTFTVGAGLSYSSQQDVVISFDASNHMHAVVTSYNSGTGALVVDVKSHTGSGTYTAWTVNVGGTTPLQSVEWGEILGTLGDQTDLATALNSKLESSTAATTYAALAGATFTGEVVTPASTTANAGLTITPGVAPTTPTNGEIWATTNDLQVRLNGVTETLAEQSWVTAGFYPLTGNPSGFLTSASLSGYALLSGATFTGKINTPAVTTASAFLNLPHGTAPTTPVNGDVWSTTGGLFARINGVSRQYVDLDGTQTINGAKTFSGVSTFSNANNSFGNSTAAGTISVASGATISGALKALNLGTSGVAGSTTVITIGSTTGTSTTTLQGSTVGATLAADTNTTGLATTAFVVGQAGSAAPLINGTATVGTSLRYARQDHVHPTDTSRAPLASPTFTGTVTIPAGASIAGFAPLASPSLSGVPLSTTAAVDTNTQQIATTAFVVGQAAAATPLVDGTAAVGTSLRFARQDHVHPTDTTRAPLASPTFTGTVTIPAGASISGFAPLASPTFTGTPSLPTGTTAVTQTAGNNTTAVATTAFVQAANLGTDDSQLLETCMEGITPALSNTSMTAVAQRANSNIWNLLNYGSAVASGSITHWFSPFDGQWYGQNGWNFSKSGNAVFYANVGLAAGATQNADCRIFWGRRNTDAVGTNIAIKGFQIRFSTAGGTMTTNFGVHNGTTLTEVSMGNATAAGFNKYLVTWDGAGNFTCFRNGVQVATSSAGPTGTVSESNGVYAGIDYKANTGNTAFHTVSYLNSFTMRGAF